MIVRNTTTSETIHLEAVPFAQGGEGKLYRVLAPQKYVTLVAKIYHPEKRTKQRYYKLQYLIQNPPVFDDPKQANLISWPMALLEKQQQFIGFLMPLAKGELLEVLATASLPKQLPATWQRFALKSKEAMLLRQKVCFNIAVAIYHIHQTGCYVMVDLKPDNILIQSNGLVSLVDLDSVEIIQGKQLLFPAPVATPEYAPPEFHQTERISAIPIEWDQFSIAIIFYKILLGIHPFAASAKGKFEAAVGLGEKIKHGLYVQNKRNRPYFDAIPPPHKGFALLSPALQYLFNRCFIQGIEAAEARPKAEDWCLALEGNRVEEELDFFSLPKGLLALDIPPLTRVSTMLFQQPFEQVIKPLLQQHEAAILQKTQQEQNQVLMKQFLIGGLCLAGIGLLCLGELWLMAVGLLLACFVWLRNSSKKQDQSKHSLQKISTIGKAYPPLLKEKIAKLFEIYQEQKQAYQVGLTNYHLKKNQLLEDWEKTVGKVHQECRQLNRELWKKKIEISQEKQEQPLWQQFLGKTVAQKQQFLNQKYLPQQLKELRDERQRQIVAIDQKYEDEWRILEANFYKKLAEIDQTVVNQKVKAKEAEEVQFVVDRQEIIDAIQAQKKVVELNFQTRVALLKNTVKSYSQQLETLEENAQNKKIVLEQHVEQQFQELLTTTEGERVLLLHKINALQERVEQSTAVCLEVVEEALKVIGITTK